MRRMLFLPVLLVGLLLAVPGCDKLTYDQAVALAKVAGMGSAETWVLAAKPTVDQIKVVAGALDVTSQALDNYSGSGDFADALPEIYQGIDKLQIPDDLKPMADSLAEAAVLGVDFWFSQNPDWKNKGTQSAQIAKAFVDSAKKSLPNALKTKVFTSARLVKARTAAQKK